MANEPKGSGQDSQGQAGLPKIGSNAPLNPKLRINEYNALDLNTAENEPGCMTEGIGRFSFYSAVRKALVEVAGKRGMATNEVKFIRVANLEGEHRLWIYSTDESDPQRIPLRFYKSKIGVTLSKILKKWKLTLPSDERRWYDVLPDTQNQSPVGPALYIDLDRPRDMKKISTEKKDDTTPQQPTPGQQSAAGSEASKTEAPKAEPPKTDENPQ